MYILYINHIIYSSTSCPTDIRTFQHPPAAAPSIWRKTLQAKWAMKKRVPSCLGVYRGSKYYTTVKRGLFHKPLFQDPVIKQGNPVFQWNPYPAGFC